jgi:hypothetical protein
MTNLQVLNCAIASKSKADFYDFDHKSKYNIIIKMKKYISSTDWRSEGREKIPPNVQSLLQEKYESIRYTLN